MSGRLETRDRQLMKDRVQFGVNGHNACYCQIIVRYMGTIAMPKDTRVWEHRIQSVHNAIKRLTDSRSTQTLVRLNLDVDGIRLCSSSGKVLMYHSRDGVASFGLCPTDDLLFCLVTFDEVSSSEGNRSAGPSCQIFRVDPRLASHKDHLETAKDFGVRCEISVDKDYCVEFPTSAHSAVELFRRFYTETLTMFNFSRDSLDVAMFIPPGFESQFSISGIRNDSDIDQSEMNSGTTCIAEVKRGGTDNVQRGSDQSKKSVLDLSTIKPLRELENVPGVLERTAIFPADFSVWDLEDLDDTLKFNPSSNDKSNCESPGSLDVGMVDDQYNSDQDFTDSPNVAENLRSQVKKFLQHCSEPSSIQLHIQRFSAIETLHLGPESPLPSLPSRLRKPGTRVGHESRLASEQTTSQKTSTPSHIQRTAVRSQSAIINQVPSERTLQMKTLVTASKLPCNGKVTLRDKQLDTENENRDNRFFFSPIINTRSKSANVQRENETFDEDLALKDKPRRMENLANISVFTSSPPWNLSFHGSLESVFSDDSDESEETKYFGSCRELAPNCPKTVGRTASWAVAFENLLNDNAGFAVFLQHLKKEFSQENLNFWLKCKEYKELPEEERKMEAEKIYETYLDPFGYECVNLDQTTVVEVKKSLHHAPVDLFDEAQKQIFKLMKEDSYSRFKTSQLYKNAVVAEMEGHPFASEQKCPDVEKDLEKKIVRSKSVKLKDDKRRLSLGFLQKKKKAGISGAHELKNDQMTKVVENEKSEPSVVNIRVTLPDGLVTNVVGRWGQKISQVLLQLGNKLESGLNFIEAIDPSTQLVLDVTKDVKTLSCKDVHLKNCALFRLTLPNEKSLAIRGRLGETVNEALEPILRKYGLTLDKVVMHIAGTGVIVKDEMVVESLNCCHVVVESLFDLKGKKKGGTIGRKSGNVVRQMTSSSQPVSRLNHVSHFEVQMRLEEVFRDVFDGKVDFGSVHFDELGIFNLEKLGKLNGRRSSSRFNLFTPRASTDKAKPKTDFSKKPQVFQTAAPDDKFFNLLMSAQSRQLDSQRGMLKKEDLQMPDFLKENCDTTPSSFQALDVTSTSSISTPSTSTPSRCLSLNDNVENASKNSWSHNIHVTNSLTSTEERSRSSSESTSTDYEWNVENDPSFGTLDHRSTQDIVHRLSRTARQTNDVSKNAEYNVDVRCNGIAGANKMSMQRTVKSNISLKVAGANGALESRTAASTFKTDNAIKSFRSSYV